MPATQPPDLVTAVPGPRSRALAERLAQVESRNVTCREPTPPILWERALGANVWDVDGNRFVDLTSGFGVANAGHGHPRVVEAVCDQADRLLHAMGDVHPAAAKVVLATDCAGVVAFDGAYHGLSFGALDTTWSPRFRDPFAARLPGATAFARYGDAGDVIRAARECAAPVGAVLVEPIQGRGGNRIPPEGFLSALRALCDEQSWLLIADEIFTGFGRTGRWFDCEHEDVIPDLLCVGKGLASGMPISACVGRAEVMDAWPISEGEALHTQTFLGHPPGCAAALASMAVIEEEKLVERAADTGAAALVHMRRQLESRVGVVDVRGRGLLLAVECDTAARVSSTCEAALARGIIALPSDDAGRVLSLMPPLAIEREILEGAIDTIAEVLP